MSRIRTQDDSVLDGCPLGVPMSRPETVLLLVVDSLRYDRLSCYGSEAVTTPFLDSLAEDGRRFERAYSTAPWTVPAHGSMFTGTLPSRHGSHRKHEQFEWPGENALAGVVSEAGYHSVGVSANPWIAPEFGFDAGFDEFHYLSHTPPFPSEEAAPYGKDISDPESLRGVRQILSWANEGNALKRLANGVWHEYVRRPFPGARRVNEAVERAVADAAGTDTLVFANYMDVHSPHYDPLLSLPEAESGPLGGPSQSAAAAFRYPPLGNGVSVQSEPVDPERGRELYDESVRRFDDRLRDLFERLDQHVDLDETLTVVVGDHGECLGEHGYWGHNTFMYEELLRVPLIVSPPDGDDRELSGGPDPVSLIDVPTFIANAVGTTMPEEADVSGRPLSGTGPVYAESTGPLPEMDEQVSRDGYAAVIDDGYKLVRNRETGETRLFEVDPHSYDRRERSVVRDRLVRLERECWQDLDVTPAESGEALAPETESHLSDLGYL